MLIEKKFSCDDIELALLFGAQDANLKKIEEFFPNCTFVARGSSLTCRGSKEEVRLIETILGDMQNAVNKTGELKKSDVEYIINAVVNGVQHQTNGDDIILINKSLTVKPKTLGQKELLDASRSSDITFAIGPAGTGKTYLSVAIAVVALKEKRVQRIVLARPAIEAGESLGFLPGELSQKIEPYLHPLYDALGDMLPPEKLKDYIDKKTIEIVPLAYMRGRTFNNAFILLDEAQNATRLQMKMFLTRLGMNSKSIVMGDVSQIDIEPPSNSGLIEAAELLQGIKGISFVHLHKVDVVRHRLVRDIIDAYEKKPKRNHASASRN